MLLDKLNSYKSESMWKGTFSGYLKIVKETPEVAQLSHERLWDMIKEAGFYKKSNGVTHYNFFDEIYGIDDTIEKVVDYFKSSARGLETRKRILLLVGPVASAKSTISILIKRGLEEYSKKHPLYAIDGCPMNEEPLHLIPENMRKDFESEYGVTIEGQLCPVCKFRLDNEWETLLDVPVKQIVLSEQNRVGIDSYSPSSEKTMDIADLVGSMNLATIGRYGEESHPLAYSFDGVLEKANRGFVDLIEFLKYPEEFTYPLLTLSTEQNIKTGRFSMIYADEVLFAHTNFYEFDKFASSKKNEAMHNRFIVIQVPYNLSVKEEVKIYDKLLKSVSKNNHIAPLTLEVASSFAVLSRLNDSPKYTALSKLHVYNGENYNNLEPKDIEEMKKSDPTEGFDGISSRQIVNALSKAIVSKDVPCITASDALKMIKQGFDEQIGSHNKEDKERLTIKIHEAREIFDRKIRLLIEEAFVDANQDPLQNLLDSYIDNAIAFVNKEKIKDVITGEMVEPDIAYMKSIEEEIGISESARSTFRQEIVVKVSSLMRIGEKFTPKNHSRLREALENHMFGNQKHLIHAVITTRTPDKGQIERKNQLMESLKARGFCEHCSVEMVQYVGTLLKK